MQIEKAMELASKYHQGQTRTGKGGKSVPYYEEHVVQVYEILRQEVGIERTDILIMALLHDTLEDTCMTVEQIEEAFGKDIAIQVQYLTKKKGQTFQDYAQMLFEEGDDRAVLVKLADRLHNLRSILYISDAKWIAKKVRQTNNDILKSLSKRPLQECYKEAATYLEMQIREELKKISSVYPNM